MRKILILLILFLMMPIAAAQAISVTIPATADGFAESSNNWSTSNIFVNPQVLSVSSSAGYEERAALEFSLSSIPSSSTIVSAYFNIWGVMTDLNIGLHGYSGDGNITAGDFTLSNQITTFDPVSVPTPALNSVDVTSYVSFLIGQAQPYAGFQLRELASESNEFVGSAYPTTLNVHPELLIEYTSSPVPEPTSMLLLGLGLMGLVGMRRKTQN